MTELSKRDLPNRLGKMIDELREEKSLLKEEKTSLRKKTAKLRNEKIQIDRAKGGGISVNMINKSISIFATGWFNYLSGLGDRGEHLIENCQKVFQNFIDEKKIDVSPLKENLI